MSTISKRPPKVLQIVPRLETGGLETGTVDVARALAAAGWDSLVVSEGGAMVHHLKRAGAQHINRPMASKSPYRVWKNIAVLETIIRECNVDLVHARSRMPAWSALYAANRLDRPFVTTFHGTYNALTPLKKAYNSVMVRGAKIIAISEYIRRHITKQYPQFADRVSVIPRGIDVQIFNPSAVSAARMIKLSESWRLRDGQPVILLPGRLTRWKGHKLLIDALVELDRKDIRCVMVGDTMSNARYRAEMEAYAARKDLGSVVQFVGGCNDMAAAYMLADVVVSASTDPEAFGRIAVEAQAMGRPVVATDHGGSVETVLHNKTGWFCDPLEPRSMARALEEALELTTDQRVTIAEMARCHICEKYTVDRMTDQTITLYTEVLKAHASKARSSNN